MSPKGRLAQLVERPVYTGMVRGSSPLAPTKVTGVGVYLRPFLLSVRYQDRDYTFGGQESLSLLLHVFAKGQVLTTLPRGFAYQQNIAPAGTRVESNESCFLTHKDR